MSDRFPLTPDRWREVLGVAAEHGSHAWAALRKVGLAHVRDEERQTWPPQCVDEVGSAAYHLAAMIRYVFEVFNGISELHPDPDDVTPEPAGSQPAGSGAFSCAGLAPFGYPPFPVPCSHPAAYLVWPKCEPQVTGYAYLCADHLDLLKRLGHPLY